LMEMAVRSMETAETAMDTDGDGSGGTSPSQQGAKTETSIPQNLSSTTVVLWNCSGKNADSPRVFRPEALYRRRGVIRGLPGRPHNGWAWPGAGPCPPIVWAASGPTPSPLRFSGSFGEFLDVRLLFRPIPRIFPV
jgi:hypothetical protein